MPRSGGGRAFRGTIYSLLLSLIALFLSHLVLPPAVPRSALLLVFFCLATLGRVLMEMLSSAYIEPRDADGRGEVEDLRRSFESLYRERIELAARVDELSTMREMALTINSDLSFPRMMETIIEVTSGTLDVEEVVLYLTPAAGRGMKAVAGRKNGLPLSPLELSTRAGIFRDELFEKLGRSARAVIIHHSGVQTLLVGLVAKGEVIGAVEAKRTRTSPPLGERERSILQSLAGTIAVAISNARLYEMAVTDGLTGLYCHRFLQHRLEEEAARAIRYKHPLSFILFDIDHFKRVNDTFGHQDGDSVLVAVSGVIKSSARTTDIPCRYGGEEMALILPETSLNDAVAIANRIRARIEGMETRSGAGKTIRVTISAGVSSLSPAVTGRLNLIGDSDAALYRAKEGGRNMVVIGEKSLLEEPPGSVEGHPRREVGSGS